MKNIKKLYISTFAILAFLNLGSCQSDSESTEKDPVVTPPVTENISFYYGADLSYLNEMEDCGAVYKNDKGVAQDAYKIFKEAGANLVRVRLWHNPTWTNYSNFNDVKKTISRAKALGMNVLLDFHYSDTWTDPEKQKIPAAWASQMNNKEALGKLLYDYTYKTLNDLSKENLLPEIVQVGNEINPMILQGDELVWPINWTRNSYLLNNGIKAVRDISKDKNKKIGVMLHIAQPENALWWFKEATANGITDYDWIGLSYYPSYSEYTLNDVSTPIKTLISTYKKRLMIVETAYPFTLNNNDNASNNLGTEALINGYQATQAGQLGYLKKLKEVVAAAGGEGIIYWEPAWVSTSCKTLWGTGSHWDNATLFDNTNKATLGMQFYNGSK
ncbi:glycoside hydrolase family 53 protein [Flavobacterium aquicola]|uniref:Arabinogalactan endo-beta-1,4-galactanase n=1 Tax=Flavobacterium aquicola TaxID=1682742 RepID=A0A3E0ESI0_9FLAO|nr:glycosyl hydrolase 53 family protein [Flavobacterium aquicola]REH01193.1 arabinogalactan endo-1,4-beta-galactosidase [Flavobacterium aquicola]